jgi:cysteine desulfurase
LIYLDHNATTPLCETVLEAMVPYLAAQYGNPSSYHQLGRVARAAVEQARTSVAATLGAQPGEIVFTSGGTESGNLALRGVTRALRHRGRHLVTSAVEHHAVRRTAQALQREGLEVTYVPVGADGQVDPGDVRRCLRPDTVLVSIMAANNETGVIQPLAAIGAVTRSAGVLLHTDAVQAVGKIPVDVGAWGVDLLSCTAHKVYGPKGTGLLYVRQGTPLTPQVTGGHHEHELRGGTENVAGIVGLGAALRSAAVHRAGEARRLTALRQRLEDGLQELEGVTIHGASAPRVPNTTSLSFAAIEGESVILHLDLRGICAATGSACTTHDPEPSHVLLAMGVAPRLAQGAVRLSLGRGNTEDEVDQVLAHLRQIVPRLRQVSSVA